MSQNASRFSLAEHYSRIVKTRAAAGRRPNLPDYERMVRDFTWDAARSQLDGLPGHRGLNIAHEAVDRHAEGSAAAHVAVDYSRPIEDIGSLIPALVADTAITSAGLGPVSRRESFTRIIELEYRMSAAGVALTNRDWWNELVTPSGLTCPECQGVLGAVHDRRVLRFRCETGHAYSAMTLLKAFVTTSEAAVGASLRALAQESEFALRLSLLPGQAPGGAALAKLAVSITGVLELRTMLRSQLQQT